MKLSFAEVADRIEALLGGTLSRLNADHWFIEVLDCEAQEGLAFEPADDESRIRRALWCLQALDLSDDAGNYLESDSQLREALEEMRSVRTL